MSAGEQGDAQEKSHEASPARLAQARREGDVPQSREVNAAAGYIGLYLAFAMGAAGAASEFAGTMARLFQEPEHFSALAFSDSASFITEIISVALQPTAIFLLLPGACVLAALAVQRSFSVAPKKIGPQLSRLSIAGNAKKKFGPEGLAEFAKSATKLIIVFAMFGVLVIDRFEALPTVALRPSFFTAHALLSEGIVFLGLIVLFSVAIAAIDFPWSQHQYKSRLRMSAEEVKRENKENEGDPTMKQNRRDRAQSIAANRMLQDVPNADVVIVNPTHYAVALTWERDKPGAPKCVAKGVDEIAARIRNMAALSGVPIRRDPLTARTLHAHVEIGDEIKREHFSAVAAAIHFADLMRAKAVNARE